MNCPDLTYFINVSCVVGHERASSLLFNCIVITLLLLIIFWCGYVRRSILYKGSDLRWIICKCYSWETALNVYLDTSFDKVLDRNGIREKDGEVNSATDSLYNKVWDFLLNSQPFLHFHELKIFTPKRTKETAKVVFAWPYFNFSPPLALQPSSGLDRLHETFRLTSVTRSRTVGRTPWKGDQLVTRRLPVHKHRKTHTRHKH
jgi:hypothetical protein